MTAKAIAVSQQKGGSGKTTIVAQLAIYWSRKGLKIAILDVDPQKSLSTWGLLRAEANIDDDVRERLKIFNPPGWKLAGEIEDLKQGFDLILIDTPPHVETDARVAIRASSLVIVPLQPSLMDLWASKGTITLAQKEKTRALMVLNRLPPRGRLIDIIREKIAEDDLPLANAALGNRSAFVNSMTEGKGVSETQPKSVANLEIIALANEIMDILEGRK